MKRLFGWLCFGLTLGAYVAFFCCAYNIGFLLLVLGAVAATMACLSEGEP